MAKPVIAGMPPSYDLGGQFVILLDAVDPTTGAAVAGVTVSDVSIFAASLGALPAQATVYSPLLTFEPAGTNA